MLLENSHWSEEGHWASGSVFCHLIITQHQGREIIAIVPLENGAFCTIFSENFYKF
jgi:hypothetical protein